MRYAVSTLNNENGATIVIALMVLAIMTIIGVSATNMSTTESLIVRNVGIYKQNLHMTDAVLAEAMETAIAFTFTDPTQLQPAITDEDWIHDKNDPVAQNIDTNWYNPNSVGRILTANPKNSEAPGSLTNDDGTGIDNLLAIRGEWDGEPDNASIRYALIGWEPAPGYSLAGTRRTGRILSEYVSEEFGLMRLEAGIELDIEL